MLESKEDNNIIDKRKRQYEAIMKECHVDVISLRTYEHI